MTDEDFKNVVESWNKPEDNNNRAIPKSHNITKYHMKLAKLSKYEIDAIYQQILKNLLEMINLERLNKEFSEAVCIRDKQEMWLDM